MFSSGAELAQAVLSSGVLDSSWDAISHTYNHTNTSSSSSSSCVIKYKIHHSRDGTIFVAFVGTLNYYIQAQPDSSCTDLVSSPDLIESGLFDFLPTKVNPAFSIHRATLDIFRSLLPELTNQLLLLLQSDSPHPLIITGHCLGGSIASLFTLWLLQSTIPTSSKRRPICITFGSPLVGDKCFQRAISERPMWNSSFCHVVSNTDFVPRFLIQARANYTPFGTFFLCSESGSACFDEPESILELLIATGPTVHQNTLQTTDYKPILEGLTRNSIYRGFFMVDGSMSSTNLQIGITTQLTAIGVGMQVGDLMSLATRAAKREERIQTMKKNAFDPNKKLNERKIDMTYIEWYKKVSSDQGGYYDNYKKNTQGREQIKMRQEITKRHKILTQYWKRMVDEAEKLPQKEGANFRTRWLYGGTNYRRLFEPLDIADYYRKGRRDYVTLGRSRHYVLLEKWYDEDGGGGDERKRACSLTEDSCFWARVEEAIVSCGVLKDGGETEIVKRSARDGLVGFERYVMGLIKKFGVSPEIFLAGSSFMKWWDEYNSVVGVVGGDLADFMINARYLNYL